jgi:hypothetical protein
VPLCSARWSRSTAGFEAQWTATPRTKYTERLATHTQAVQHVARHRAGGLRFHDLRHSYTTWLVDDGVPPDLVQRVMGHECATTTLDLYTRRTDNGDRILAALDDDPTTSQLRRDAMLRRCSDHCPTNDERPGRRARGEPLTRPFGGGRYWDRTSDLFGVNADYPCLLASIIDVPAGRHAVSYQPVRAGVSSGDASSAASAQLGTSGAMCRSRRSPPPR